MSNDPNEIVSVVHYAGRYKTYKPGWHVFTDYLFSDGGELCVDDNGPFASEQAAQMCVDLADGLEEVTPRMVSVARRQYLRRTFQ